MLRKDHSLLVNAKFVSVGYVFFDKQPKFDNVMSNVKLHANMTPLTVEDRLLIKTSQTEKGWIV